MRHQRIMQFVTPFDLMSTALLRLGRRPISQTQCWRAAKMIPSKSCDQSKQKKGIYIRAQLTVRLLIDIIVQDNSDEESFYRYTSGRWLFKEDEQMAKRYVRFDITALKQAASNVVKSPCVSITKLPEGLFNKVFLLKMGNDQELIAKIPNPNAGVEHFTVASEVATLELLRTVLHIPVPEVYAWNSCSSLSNPVGAEYIIMGKVAGNELDQIWPEMSESDRFNLVKSVVQVEAKLASTKFSKYGSLYYAGDGTDQGHSSVTGEKVLFGLEDDVSRKFVIGKSVESGFWAEERSKMDIDRGPWTSVEGYFTAVAKREIAWITSYAKQDTQYDLLQSKLHIELLEKFLQVLPHIIPIQEDILSPTLWHTDLHRRNIFVEPAQSSQISGIIDWQGEWLAPFFRQARFASAFECDWDYPWGPVMPPLLREDIDVLSEDERQNAQLEYTEVKLKKFYEIASRKFNPLLFRALDSMQIEDNNLIPSIFGLVGRSWTDGPIPLRHLLIQVTLSWESLMGGKNVTCPISFSQTEIERSSEEAEKWANAYNEFHALRSRLVGKEGWVSHEEYYPARTQLEQHKGQLKELQAKLKAAGGTDVDNVF